MTSNISNTSKSVGNYLRSHTKEISNGLKILTGIRLITDTDNNIKLIQADVCKEYEEES